MSGLGSGVYGELTFLDLISLCSFLIALQNLDSNISQDDMQELQATVSKKTNKLLSEIHYHLDTQDKKIDRILQLLEEKDNGNTRDI